MAAAKRGRKSRLQKNIKKESDSGKGPQGSGGRTSAMGARIGESGLSAGASAASKARKTARIDAVERRRLKLQKIKRDRAKAKKGKK